MRWLSLMFALVGCSAVQPSWRHTEHNVQVTVEVGVIDGAPFRIDVPRNWNGELLLYCHGYSAVPITFDPAARDAGVEAFLSDSVAVAQSAYSATGYALIEGARDTERLLVYFSKAHRVPGRIWVAGHSLGGSITMMLLETRPKTFDGGLALCTPLGAATSYIKTLIFDPVVLFRSWYPEHLPPPDAVPASYAMSVDRASELAQLLDANPEASAVLRNYTTARTNQELGLLLDLYAYVSASCGSGCTAMLSTTAIPCTRAGANAWSVTWQIPRRCVRCSKRTRRPEPWSDRSLPHGMCTTR